MVERVRAGRSPEDLSRAFEPTMQSISKGVVLADKQEGRREGQGDGLSAAERDELARLRGENKQLRLERDILSRSAAGQVGASRRRGGARLRAGIRTRRPRLI